MTANKSINNLIRILITSFVVGVLCGCSATSVMVPLETEKPNGSVRFYQGGKLLKIHVNLSELTPNLKYRLHVHEVGDCRNPVDGSTGQPFDSVDPTQNNDAGRPTGHLGSTQADENGVIDITFNLLEPKLFGPPNVSILGRSLVLSVLEGNEETISRPVACGLISKNSAL